MDGVAGSMVGHLRSGNIIAHLLCPFGPTVSEVGSADHRTQASIVNDVSGPAT